MDLLKKLRWPLFRKPVKIVGFVLIGIVLILLVLPLFFSDSVGEKIRDYANKNIDGELNYRKISLSFYRHFPNLTLSIHDFLLLGSAPYRNDTLVSAREISFGINVGSLFANTIKINKIYLENGYINIQVSANGEPNYNVYAPENEPAAEPTPAGVTDTVPDNTSFRIEKITLRRCHLVYNDLSVPILIDARDFNYEGKGDLSKSIFDLYTDARIGALDLAYDGVPYIQDKEVSAELVTKINTSSLAFVFERNDLKINQLPVRFTGRFSFLGNGYDMEFMLTSDKTGLRNLFTALPPDYLTWLEKTQVTGDAIITTNLSGKYITETNSMPDLNLTLKVDKGYISYDRAPAPVENLTVNFETRIPGLNVDSLVINIDSLHFNIGEDYFTSVIRMKGIGSTYLFARLDTEIDLEKWARAYGIPGVEVHGRYELHLDADGLYAVGPDTSSIRKDTVVLSIPKFEVRSSLSNGYFKYASLPQPLRNMGFNISASCSDGIYNHIRFSLDDLNAEFLDNFLRGYLQTSGVDVVTLSSNLTMACNLADITKVIPLDSIDVKGMLNFNLDSKGNYALDGKQFPLTKLNFTLKDGYLKTNYYPNPVENIFFTTNIDIPSENPADAAITIDPFTFMFEGKPFSFKASLKDFTDLDYQISSVGDIDVGKIYQVFAVEGVDVDGLIEADFKLAGKKSDVMEGRYSRLNNSGYLRMHHIAMRSELFPKPFIIESGWFTFNQEKIGVDELLARYGQSDFRLDGYLTNIISYLTEEQGKLKGNLKLRSSKIVVDEFMAYAPQTDTAKTPATDTVTAGNQVADSVLTASEPAGVVIVPDDLEIAFTADAGYIDYQGLVIRDFHGLMEIRDGLILLKETGFTLVDAPFVMDATYGSITPLSAYFDYRIRAEDFDIHKAYLEIPMFREMCAPAENAQGIVSLDYSLKGTLDQDMMPVMPSLEGGGTLSVKKVKISGFKMFSAVSKKTQKEELKDPDLSKVDIKTTISKNTITIEPFKFRFAGFRPKIAGEATLDGRMNIRMRLGLPPMGIFGLPIRITGTQDDPKIRFSKGSNEADEIPETEYSDEIPPDMLKLIKDAKATGLGDDDEDGNIPPGEKK